MKCNQMPTGLETMLKKAQNDPAAAYTAALLLEDGHRGGPQAVQFFCERAAEGGYTTAMLKLAGMYISGQYIHDDPREADAAQDLKAGAEWLRRAVDAGDETANYMLAHCYCEGIGVERSRAKAMYFVGLISSPEFSISLCETEEIFIFGEISSELHTFAHRCQRANSLSLAG